MLTVPRVLRTSRKAQNKKASFWSPRTASGIPVLRENWRKKGGSKLFLVLSTSWLQGTEPFLVAKMTRTEQDPQVGRNRRGRGGAGRGQQVHQLPQHTCLGRGTSQLLSVGGSPVALLGCTEADMDFWCWRGRAAETAAEAEAVEARDPGMVRLGDKSSGEAWVRGRWGQGGSG